jgi:hypothetical protein
MSPPAGTVPRVTLHAFADESCRGGRYLLAVALVDPAELASTRRLVRSLLLPGQRELHCKKESPARRRQIISTLVSADTRAWMYLRRSNGDQEQARQQCLDRLVADMVRAGAKRLVLDSREDRDRYDEGTIRAVLGSRPRETGLIYEHLNSTHELLLGIPDMVAWCYGAGGDWRRRIGPAISATFDLDCA